MVKYPHRTSALATGTLALLFVVAFTLTTDRVSAVDCVGKPYGYPGCPTRPQATVSTSSAGATTCGNAIVDSGEECDKGRFNGKTDCSPECKTYYCGDGEVTKEVGEECEPETQEVYVQDKNGNLTTEIRFIGNAQCGWYCQPPSCNETGKCTGGCKLKYISQCPMSESSVAPATTGTSGSSASGSTQSTGTSSAPPLPPLCGNAVVEAGEQCDDGNRNPADNCTNSCMRPRCGDAIVHTGEECDDANQDNTDGCTTICTLPRCGDGVRQGREECDQGAGNSDRQPNTCRTNCTPPHCGDGITDTGEQCDAGIQNSNLLPNACRTICRLAFCGDGVKDVNEECDDGNRSDIDSCTTVCKLAGCGDGILQAGEDCDWGIKNSDSDPNACRRTCRLPRCGDTVLDTGEQCDGGSDCSESCAILETAGAPSGSASSAGVPVATVPAESGGSGPVIATVLGAFGVLMIGAALLLKRKLKNYLTAKKVKSLDDIPLDQIEMPWHRW